MTAFHPQTDHGRGSIPEIGTTVFVYRLTVTCMNVLLGLGGSDESVKTLRQTIERTREVGDDLTVVIVDKPESKRSQDEMYQQALDQLEEAGITDIEIEKLEGDPGSALVNYAEQGSTISWSSAAGP